MQSFEDDVDGASLRNYHTSDSASIIASGVNDLSTSPMEWTRSQDGVYQEFRRDDAAGAIRGYDSSMVSHTPRTANEDLDYAVAVDLNGLKVSGGDASANLHFDTSIPGDRDRVTQDAIATTVEDNRLTAKIMQDVYDGPWQLERSMAIFAESRKFFETDSGHIGIGPSDTAVGDQVVILYGHEMPLVLRGCEDEAYSYYIDACYVQDIMKVSSPYVAAAAVFSQAVLH